MFDGTKTGAYLESDEPHPINVYGSSKLAGEQAVFSSHPAALVIRTAWTYGLGGTNFPVKILQRARAVTSGAAEGSRGGRHRSAADVAVAPVLQVVADEVGSPTYTIDLANGLLALLSAGATGLYHLTGAGSCSRYELALETLRLAGFAVPGDLTVEPVTSASLPDQGDASAQFGAGLRQGGGAGRAVAGVAGRSRPVPGRTLEWQRGRTVCSDVVIVAHNAGHLLAEAVASAVEQAGAERVWVMDADSTDGSVDVLRRAEDEQSTSCRFPTSDSRRPTTEGSSRRVHRSSCC